MKWSTAKRRINKTLDELFKSVADEWYANYRNGYVEGYIDARQGIAPKYAEAYTADRKTEPQTEEWHDDCNTCRWHDGACTIPCCDYEPKTEPQTNADNAFQNVESVGCDRYVITNDEGERAYNCIGCERTDCSWK